MWDIIDNSLIINAVPHSVNTLSKWKLVSLDYIPKQVIKNILQLVIQCWLHLVITDILAPCSPPHPPKGFVRTFWPIQGPINLSLAAMAFGMFYSFTKSFLWLLIRMSSNYWMQSVGNRIVISQGNFKI